MSAPAVEEKTPLTVEQAEEAKSECGGCTAASQCPERDVPPADCQPQVTTPAPATGPSTDEA